MQLKKFAVCCAVCATRVLGVYKTAQCSYETPRCIWKIHRQEDSLMPNSLASATQPRDTSKMTLLTPSAGGNLPTPNLSADPEFCPTSLAPIPPVMGTETDASRQFYRTGVSQVRTPPLPAAAKIAQGAQAQSQIILAGGGSSGGPLLQTNNVNNGDQEKLNLTGSGVTYGPGAGQVQIATGTGDGLIHGQSPWESDPSFVQFRDDFISPSSASTSGAFTSEQSWFFSGPENLKTYGLNPSLMGGMIMTTDASANHTNFLIPAAALSYSTGSVGWAIFENPSWIINYTFIIVRGEATTASQTAPAFSFTQVSYYIGFGAQTAASSFSSTTPSARPNFFVGLRYDTDTTSPAISDTSFKFEAVCNSANAGNLTRSNVQGNTFSTGIVPTEGRKYRFTMECTASGQVTMTLVDGVTSATSTLTVPSYSFTGVSHLVENGFAAVQPNGVIAPISVGSTFTVAGTGISAYDGTHVAVNGSTGWVNYFTASGNLGNTFSSGATLTGLPALAPWISFGNDSTATPVAFSKGVVLDLVAFVWNPGVNSSSSASPNPILARYF